MAWLSSHIPPGTSQYPGVWAVRAAACGTQWELCINLVLVEGTGRMHLIPRPCAASQHGNQQPATPRNELKLTRSHTALLQGGNIPLGTVQCLVHTRGAASMQGFPSLKNIIRGMEMKANPAVSAPQCHLQHCLAEGTLVPICDSIRAAVRVGLPRAVHASVYELSTNLHRE